MKRPHPFVPIVCLVLSGFSVAAEKPDTSPVAFQTHDGYFVSNQFEPQSPTSFAVLKDQAAFDQVFGIARVMRDKSRRLTAESFADKWVVTAIHRGKSVVTYQVQRVITDGKTLNLRYTTHSGPPGTAEFGSPLIVSVPKGVFETVRFIEDGKEIKVVGIAVPAPFEITAKEVGTLTATEEVGKTILSIKGGTGIGKATVRRMGDAWPKEVVVRAYLGGLESFSVSDGVVKLSASVSSHSGNKQLLHLWKDGNEGPALDEKSPYWMEIHRRDAAGNPVQGLPPKEGWFEMTLPQALLKEKTLELEWIDFYR